MSYLEIRFTVGRLLLPTTIIKRYACKNKLLDILPIEHPQIVHPLIYIHSSCSRERNYAFLFYLRAVIFESSI